MSPWIPPQSWFGSHGLSLHGLMNESESFSGPVTVVNHSFNLSWNRASKQLSQETCMKSDVKMKNGHIKALEVKQSTVRTVVYPNTIGM